MAHHVRVTSWRFISIAVLGLSLLCGFASARSSVIDTAVRKIPLWRAERLHTDIALRSNQPVKGFPRGVIGSGITHSSAFE